MCVGRSRGHVGASRDSRFIPDHSRGGVSRLAGVEVGVDVPTQVQSMSAIDGYTTAAQRRI